MRLAGKVAIISGAASGMGAATARMFAREGAKVVVADVLEHEGRQVAGAIGASARFEPLDSAPYERARLHLAIAYYPDCDTRDPVQHSGWGPAGAPLTLVPRGSIDELRRVPGAGLG